MSNRQLLVVVLAILQKPQSQLLQVALTPSAPRVFPRAGESREKYRREDRDDSYDDQKFNQGEASRFLFIH